MQRVTSCGDQNRPETLNGQHDRAKSCFGNENDDSKVPIAETSKIEMIEKPTNFNKTATLEIAKKNSVELIDNLVPKNELKEEKDEQPSSKTPV